MHPLVVPIVVLFFCVAILQIVLHPTVVPTFVTIRQLALHQICVAFFKTTRELAIHPISYRLV